MQELKTSGRIDLTVVPLYSFQRLSRDYDDNAVFRRDSDTALSNSLFLFDSDPKTAASVATPLYCGRDTTQNHRRF